MLDALLQLAFQSLVTGYFFGGGFIMAGYLLKKVGKWPW